MNLQQQQRQQQQQQTQAQAAPKCRHSMVALARATQENH
jgi:hypothetical protein